MIDPVKCELISVLVTLDEAPKATRFHVHLINHSCQSFRPPPLRNMLRIGVDLEHKVTRRVEDPAHEDYLISRFSDEISLCHAFSPPLVVLADTRPSDQIWLPTGGGRML